MLRAFWDFLGSLKLTLVLLFILTGVSLVGIILPQGLSPEQYAGKWGNALSKIILFAGLDRVFSSLWFYLLLGFLSANITTCAITRLWRNLTRALYFSFLESREHASKAKYFNKVGFSGNPETASEQVSSRLRALGYRCAMQATETGQQVAAKKGLMKEIGSIVFHLSLLLLFVGGLIGRMGGYSYLQQLREGEISAVAEREFLVRNDGFRLEKNEKGAIKDYKSRLSVLGPDSTVILAKTIEVNDPLSHAGIRFYQSSYGEDLRNPDTALFRIQGPGLPKEGQTARLPVKDTVAIGETGITGMVTEYLPDFAIDMKTKKTFNRSENPNNPAYFVHLSSNKGDTLFRQWVFGRFPRTHMEESDYRVTVVNLPPRYYTGIQIRYNPGVPVIWVGIVLMTLGILTIFAFSRISLWVLFEGSAENQTQLWICGRSDRPFGFGEEFERICEGFGSIAREGKAS